MAGHQDAYISDVVVMIDDDEANRFEDVVARLKKEGFDLRDENRDQGVVEGSINSSKLCEIDDLPGVKYVRSVFTYVADFPAGDPRDQDGVNRGGDEETWG
jgi:hypothetical protein